LLKVNWLSVENVAASFRVEEATQETSMKQTAFLAGSVLGLFFNLEDGGDMFFQNVS
jgi:hypothetical protein